MNGHHSHKELYYDVSDETDSDSDDFDQDDIPEFKMVFVVNTSLDMGPGKFLQLLFISSKLASKQIYFYHAY